MFDTLFHYPRVLARHRDGPSSQERELFLNHCAKGMGQACQPFAQQAIDLLVIEAIEDALQGFRHKFQSSEDELYARKNLYFVLTRDQRYLHQYSSINRKYLDGQGQVIREEPLDIPDVPLWTDHFSSLTPIEIHD